MSVFFSRFMGNESQCGTNKSRELAVRNKQIAREPLRGSRDLFVPHCDSFPMNREKRHSFLYKTHIETELSLFAMYTNGQKKAYRIVYCIILYKARRYSLLR